MQYNEFVSRVQENARIETPEAAQQVIEAVLETLGERLYRTERDRLSAQLPGELKTYLSKRDEPGPTRRNVDRFTLEDFYNRASARSGSGYPETVRQTQAVMAALSDAVSPDVLDELAAEMPEEFKKLFSR